MVLPLLVQSLWFILPAYSANALPVIAKGKHPLDFGRNFMGNRLLGDGKTLEGSVTGIAFGTLAGTLQVFAQPYMPSNFVVMTTGLAFVLSFGAIFGDIVGAFIKRRLGIPRGGSAPLLDQLDFLTMALLLSAPLQALDVSVYAALIIMTPIVHLSANKIGHYLKLKEVPW